MENKERFLDIVKKNIKREGIEKLISTLEKTDFFIAPASRQYHDSFEGGLVKHSIEVWDELMNQFNDEEYKLHGYEPSLETITIVSLFHDLCKIGFYKKGFRNKKEENGKWIQVDTYEIDDQYPYGHGEKSVDLLRDFIQLTEEEKLAIRWHMGAYEGEKHWNNLSEIYRKYPLVLYLHIADMKASHLN